MAQRRLFGTDGIRAPFGEPPLDRETVTTLGLRLGELLTEERAGALSAPTVVIGGDTRDSTPTLCRWLASGLHAGGVRVRYTGVLTTPGIAYLARHLKADVGIAVSASHNPHPDNGIKLIDRHGYKWSEPSEARLEERLTAVERDLPERELPEPATEAVAVYLAALESMLPPGEPLTGLSVVLDPGHGAASPFAERLFSDLGARVRMIHAEPDGTNINRDAGSTHPEALARAVQEQGADLGIAFDGDADRAILVDETGAERDGDAILYLWATRLQDDGGLRPPKIVATSMSNLGLEKALESRGIGMLRCDVGDRIVVETMQREGLVLGGEQSGHVVHLTSSTTGDGLLTALQMAGIAARGKREERSFSELLAGFVRYPQVLLNVRVAQKPPFEELPEVMETARSVEERLGDDGRLVLRYSGTEPKARVMIEGKDQDEIDALAAELADTIRGAIGAEPQGERA